MSKIINLIFMTIIIMFFFSTYKFYTSKKNIETLKINRLNIEKKMKDTNLSLPILEDDTNEVIEFNDSLSEDIKNNKKRNFWNLLKFE